MRTATAIAAGLACVATVAFAPTRAAAAPIAVESCVSSEGAPTVENDLGAELDADDARVVAAAIAVRFPVVASHGLLPQRLLLARRRNGAWLYVALRADAGRRDGVCATATFVADRFEVTPALIRKYFGVGA